MVGEGFRITELGYRTAIWWVKDSELQNWVTEVCYRTALWWVKNSELPQWVTEIGYQKWVLVGKGFRVTKVGYGGLRIQSYRSGLPKWVLVG